MELERGKKGEKEERGKVRDKNSFQRPNFLYRDPDNQRDAACVAIVQVNHHTCLIHHYHYHHHHALQNYYQYREKWERG